MPNHDPRPASLGRRRFLQGTALTGVAAFLAACTGTRQSAAPGASAAASAAPGASAAASEAPASEVPATPQTATGPLMFANWPAYIDLAGDAGEAGEYAAGSSPTLEEFAGKYGIEVDYQEKIGDNSSFMATIEPALVGGLATGWDLIVLTDWMASQVIANGWAEALDPANVPNCVANVQDSLKGVTWDAEMAYHYPWQSGMTGIGVNTKTLADNGIAEPTKIADLWNIPADKLTFLSEARDTFGLVLLKMGIDANGDTVTAEQIDAATADMQPLVDKGLRFTGNEYLQDFGQKKVWGAFVWSGDLASSGGEDDKFIFPEEGTLIWTDNMLIPKGAANKYTAELMMDFVYDPKIAAQIANYVYYVSPVKGADEEIKALDPEAATNPLLFPTPEIVAKQHNFQSLTPEMEDLMNERFADLSGT
ncbi:MAG TPA: spermidine/putrescine ABC transporter substrate-binding protein [Candidatus Saccharimonadales bacterium]|nr:spermidine/putrescine ABC transporter substrate-binding protein [Candidatus Saccharimonadales bacterium]